ncbi:hypothetical protein MGMO_122c00220 [Methyloglobulus morosus KoM1]|uniref:Uncharacterized protein n=1 Tax=Methyloglobulus morosus KoM1 TaxID=1116472 RepID=V5DSU1_9GAMM|nr:hypothetical protein [Methyloglobulus morosus]ESS70461.1 hypothetical protein MGMO_122c00220 [Methyloglobulus morosus KoM1]
MPCVCEQEVLEQFCEKRSLTDFYELRKGCRALNKILIPDDKLQEHQNFCEHLSDSAFHQSIALLAFKRGHLRALTKIIHNYCLDGEEIHNALTKQYRNDLRETWGGAKETKDRFNKFRMYQGRINELLFCSWLEAEGWQIQAMEAHGGCCDVEANKVGDNLVVFEVKSIGHEELLFELELEAFEGDGVSCGSIDVYEPFNYLILRVYEAAKQLFKLKSKATRKTVIMILSDYEMNFEIPLKEDWVNWSNPKFLEKENVIDAGDFIKEKRKIKKDKENLILDQDIIKYISFISDIWFFKITSEFKLQLMKTVCVKND